MYCKDRIIAAYRPALLTGLLLLCLPRGAAAGEQWAYVWQQAWTTELRTALTETRPLVTGFMVLTADARFDGARPELRRPTVDWALLATLEVPVVAVVRVNRGFADRIQRDPDAAAHWLGERFDDARRAAAQTGLRLAGVQLDYDCPTERLGAYARFLHALPHVGDAPARSITALPDWLGQAAFPTMLDAVDQYVLQVHGLDRPRNMDDPVTLFDPARARGWITQAAGLDTPFHVALPTYGYQLFFDSTGDFVGLGAEGTAAALSGTRARALRADPAVLGVFAQTLRDAPPRNGLGLAWFRMPVAGDTLNWRAATWRQVLRGDAVTFEITAELSWPQPALLEVYLNNPGTAQPTAECRVPIALPMEHVAAYDTHNGFRLEKTADGSRLQLLGPGPAPDARVLAAWFRFSDTAAVPTVCAGKVGFAP